MTKHQVAFKDRVIELAEKTGHIGQARDIAAAELIPESERCGCCQGSGNMLLSWYFQCLACKGDGRSRGKEAEKAAEAEFRRQFPEPQRCSKCRCFCDNGKCRGCGLQNPVETPA